MKKLVISVVAASLMGSAFAGQYVQRPCEQWTVGVTGIWWKTADQTSFVSFTPSSTSSSLNLSQNIDKFVNGSYDPGFIVNLGYQLSPCNDVNLSYLRLRTSDTNAFSISGVNSNFSSRFDLSALSSGTFVSTSPVSSSGSGTRTINLDQVDLTVGHKVNFNFFDVHFFSGLRYTHFVYNLTSNITDALLATVGSPGITIPVNEVDVDTQTAHYWGIGPLAGIDGTWWVWNGFGLTGEFDGSILVGGPNSKTNFVGKAFTSNLVVQTAIQNATNDFNAFQTVPVLDAKMGVVYKTPFMSSFGVKLETGYEAVEYFNINGGSNIGFAGPYGSATFSFA